MKLLVSWRLLDHFCADWAASCPNIPYLRLPKMYFFVGKIHIKTSLWKNISIKYTSNICKKKILKYMFYEDWRRCQSGNKNECGSALPPSHQSSKAPLLQKYIFLDYIWPKSIIPEYWKNNYNYFKNIYFWIIFQRKKGFDNPLHGRVVKFPSGLLVVIWKSSSRVPIRAGCLKIGMEE